MDNYTILECPNCGGSDFIEIGPHKQRCAYCGTVVTLPAEAERATVECPHCGAENERDAALCHNCGRPLAAWPQSTRQERDPALVSLLVTAATTFFVPVPVIGPAAGLYLGYKALKKARSGGPGSEKLAQVAIAAAWVALLLPVCALATNAGMHTAQFIYGWLRVLLPGS